MDEHELCLLSLEDVAAEIREKRISPVDVTQALLGRIERFDAQLNSYMIVMREDALAAARRAEQEIARGEYRGALHGVPVGVKDLFATRGVRTTAGTKVLADWVPDYDATAVTKLRGAGAIIVGKLGMHEAAYGTTSDNMHYGAIRNPWDLAHVPGGSSGGSGAATAAGLAYATLGSDTGGSIRMPAAACGVVGFMPTYGRASLYGAIPLSWTLDHAGPLTRTVRDAAIVMQAISGHDPLDPGTAEVPVPEMLDGIERGAAGLRVGVPKQFFWDDLDPEVESAVRKAIAVLGAAGASVSECDFPHVQAYRAAMAPIMLAEASAYHESYFPSRRNEYSEQVAGLLDAGLHITGVQYVQAKRVLQEARAGGADAMLDGVDVWAIPTMPIPPPAIEETRERDYRRMASLTSIADLTGQPAISVPCGLTSTGLPVGISFVARRWDEASALRAARAYEILRGSFPTAPFGAN